MAWKAEIKKLIEDDTLEVNVQATQIMACLAASHVSYEAEFGPDLFFVIHPIGVESCSTKQTCTQRAPNL